MSLDLKSLISKCNHFTRAALQAAAGLCLSRSHYDIEIEHYLMKLLDQPDGDMARILHSFSVDKARVAADLARGLDKLKSGNAREPAMSPSLAKMLRESWLAGSVDFGATQIRSGFTILALVSNDELSRMLVEISPELKKIDAGMLRRDLVAIVTGSREDSATEAPAPASTVRAGGGKTPHLDQYTVN